MPGGRSEERSAAFIAGKNRVDGIDEMSMMRWPISANCSVSVIPRAMTVPALYGFSTVGYGTVTTSRPPVSALNAARCSAAIRKTVGCVAGPGGAISMRMILGASW